MKILQKMLLVLLSLLIPLLLLLTSIRLLFNPLFLDLEYGLANFPPDEFGFTTADRLKWGKISLDYLTNTEGSEFLGNLRFENGEPLYNERELSHMVDVKNLVQAGLKAWYGLLVLFGLMAFLSWRTKKLPQFWRALSTGGWLTIGLIVAILAAVAIDFDALFAGFHAIFFQGDSWLFYTSDTLIRLFPLKLWSDAFIFMGVFTLVMAVIFALGGNRLAARKQKIG